MGVGVGPGADAAVGETVGVAAGEGVAVGPGVGLGVDTAVSPRALFEANNAPGTGVGLNADTAVGFVGSVEDSASVAALFCFISSANAKGVKVKEQLMTMHTATAILTGLFPGLICHPHPRIGFWFYIATTQANIYSL